MWLVHNHGSVLSVGKPPSAHCPSENLLLFSKRGERMECSRPHHLNASNNEEETSLSWAQRRAAITAIQTTTNNVTVTLDRVGEKLLTSDLNSILRYFGRLRRWEDICQLFHWMEKHGNITAPSYTSFITLMGKARLPINALDLYCNSKDKSIKSNVFVCNAMLKCLISNGRVQLLLSYLSRCRMAVLIPDIVTYSTLTLNAYAAKGKYEEAEKLVDEMKSSGIVPNKVVLNSLIKVYVKSGHFGKAKKVLAELDASGHISIERPYCTVMHGLAKAGKIGEAQKVFNEMKAKGIKSDGYSYSVMISSYSKTGNFEKVKKLAKEIENIKVNYDLAMMNTLLKAYSRVGDMESVSQTLMKMDKLKISPNWITFSTLISYFCEEKLYDLAVQTLEDMQIKGHQPTKKLCSPLITGLRESGKTEEALKVYNQLKCSHHQLSNTFHENMLNSINFRQDS